MKISANSVRQGHIIEYQNNLWVVSKKPEHTKPGKGGAYIQLEMKNIKNGVKLNRRFSSSEHLTKAMIEERQYQYLYQEKDQIILMDISSFEQIQVPQTIISTTLLQFLVENTLVILESYEDKPINLVLPSTMELEIVETSPYIKGATVTASYKPAILSNGVKIMVPPYLTTGEKIVVKLSDLSFVERVK